MRTLAILFFFCNSVVYASVCDNKLTLSGQALAQLSSLQGYLLELTDLHIVDVKQLGGLGVALERGEVMNPISVEDTLVDSAKEAYDIVVTSPTRELF